MFGAARPRYVVLALAAELALGGCIPYTVGSTAQPAGGFGGVRLGRRDFGVSLELGAYYDRSALGIRSHDVIVVPAITLHGREFLGMVGGILGR